MKKILGLCVFISMQISANDSTGFVATGGVQYLKNPKISMQSEDLFISKNIIRVNYQFKNLTAQDITETVLFPLPRVGSSRESDFAHTEQLIESFKVQANAQKIQPETHVRAFLPALTASGDFNANGDVVDVTAGLKKCGFSDRDLMYPWLLQQDSTLNQRLYRCQDQTLQQLLKPYQADDEIYWESQIIYSWQQKFKANALTHVQHEYMPLVGGSVSLYPEEDEKTYCMDQNFKVGLKKAKSQYAPYQALGYILKTGANWAKPIQSFKLTIERDPNELVSFCWKGQVKKISSTQFQMTEKNFVPKQDLDIIFVRKF